MIGFAFLYDKKLNLNKFEELYSKDKKRTYFFMSKALKELEGERLIRTEGNFIELTEIGQEKST